MLIHCGISLSVTFGTDSFVNRKMTASMRVISRAEGGLTEAEEIRRKTRVGSGICTRPSQVFWNFRFIGPSALLVLLVSRGSIFRICVRIMPIPVRARSGMLLWNASSCPLTS